MDKALGYLGLMRKANAVAIGETDTGAAAKSGKAVLICLASDASDNAAKRAETFAYARAVPVVRLPYEKQTISELVGKAGCSMLAMTDLGFAAAFAAALADGDTASDHTLADALKAQQSAQRKRSGSAGVRIGKRRTIE
jgi:ribosomal protein L7Ae-like RNA K-turn-binding protein